MKSSIMTELSSCPHLDVLSVPQLSLAAAPGSRRRDGVGPQIGAVVLLQEVLGEYYPLELRVSVLVRVFEQKAVGGELYAN